MNCINQFFIMAIISIEVMPNRITDLNKIKDHINAKDHDTKIDHEAFLGADVSKKYENLTEEESKNRLRKLVKTKVDIDGDEMITETELRQWISHIALLTKEKERDDMFKTISNSSDGVIDYSAYLTRTYGLLKVDELDETSKENLRKMKLQDNRKWQIADENDDGKLDKNEFLVFLHPEDYPKMRSLVIQEALEISDKNGDGVLDLEEYISDIWSASSELDRPDEGMLTLERDNFHNYRDLDKDGRLDETEIGEWLMPSEYDATVAETRHLMHHSDADEDGSLSIDEILASHDIFVGSQATDYGNSLKHEDL